jgi:uncharacterized protein YabE (DUF348 family)
MRPSPARVRAPEPESWIPIESLESLPELEELLDPRFLVDSGQSRAVKMGEDGRGYVFIDPEVETVVAREHQEKVQRSQRKWQSHARTLRMKKRVKFQRTLFVVLILTILAAALSVIFPKMVSKTSAPAHHKSVFWAVPVAVPVEIEGVQSVRLSVATSMKDFLREQHLTKYVSLNKSFDRNDFATKRSAPKVVARFQKEIDITIDGVTQHVRSTDLTVGDVLKNNGIVLGGQDISIPAQDVAAKGVTTIAVTRVSTTTRSAEQAVAFQTIKRNDPKMLRGSTKVIQQGKNGLENVTYTQTLNNNVVVSEVISSRAIVKRPISKIIAIGTRVPQTQSGKGTYYSAPRGTCAHKSLPKGTMLTVTNVANGKSVQCRVADRGPFAAGRIVDLSKSGFSQIASTSTGVISVKLTW